MKAVIWKDLNTVEYTEVPEPSCKPGWVKIRVMAVGLCATEVALIRGTFDGARPPHILGHEICGDIVELGEHCDASLLHRRVVVETYVGCGECEFCRTGRKHLCQAGEIGYPPYNGGDAQFVVVPQGCVRLIPDNISYEEGAILEAVACPFGAMTFEQFRKGASILVQGTGVAGLSFIKTARAMEAGQIFCTVRNDTKAALVRRAGAQAIDLRLGDPAEQILAATGGMGVDYSVDAVGSSQTIETAIRCVKSGGDVILYGIPDKDDPVALPVIDCILRQIRITGYTGNEKCWDPLIRLVSEGKINVRDMVSATFPLSQFQDALDLLSSRHSDIIKVVLHPWE